MKIDPVDQRHRCLSEHRMNCRMPHLRYRSARAIKSGDTPRVSGDSGRLFPQSEHLWKRAEGGKPARPRNSDMVFSPAARNHIAWMGHLQRVVPPLIGSLTYASAKAEQICRAKQKRI